jgi:hypothetical protein
MSAPLPDYNNQMLAYLQIWRDILEKAATATTALAANMAFTPPGMPFAAPGMAFTPPGMPFAAPGMPMMPGIPPMMPAPSVAAPAPGDYAQQLFSYLQAWRQYLEQFPGASPGSPQPSTAQAGNAAEEYSTKDSAGESNPTYPHLTRVPPAADDIGRTRAGERGAAAATSASESDVPTPPRNSEQSASASRYGRKSRNWPPDLVPGEPRSPGGSQIPGASNATNSLLGAGPEPPARPIPPIFDDLNQAVPPGFQYDLGSPATTRRPSPTAPAQRPAGSPFLAAMGRVTPDASPQVKAQTRFKNAGQTPSP